MNLKPLILLASLFITGCATSIIHTPVPEPLVSKAKVMNSPSIRFWGDEETESYRDTHNVKAWLKQRSRKRNNGHSNPIINFLALSGGGEDGSFAAGIITGWTQNGDRPEFDVITGVSAGALASPFVFLGPEYDKVLFDVYSNLGHEDIYRTQIFSGIFGGSAILDTRPLKSLISKYVTVDVLNKIAQQHLQGRRLWIGTTNLDAGRPVIWDIGEIALSGIPNALDLVHNILLASSAVPGIFPPVIINVTADDQKFTELHVDGGVTRQAFLYPPQLVETNLAQELDNQLQRRLFIIRNGRSQAIYEPVNTNLYSIALKSLSMTIENKAIGDLYRIYEITSRDGIEYNLAIIPKSFNLKPKQSFDPEYTKALFRVGYELAKDGYPWEKAPPESKTR
ncbi:MAG: patatin-like phospholipase family protein [Gammaproteobacteria bacterium]